MEFLGGILLGAFIVGLIYYAWQKKSSTGVSGTNPKNDIPKHDGK